MKIRFLRYLYITVLFGAILASCSKPVLKDEAMTLYTESMKIHDEIMPRMDEMYTLEIKLKALQDTLLIDSTANAQKIAIVKERLFSLESSGKSMMDWMHNIKEVPGAEPRVGHEHYTEHQHHSEMQEVKPEEILNIQQEQKSKIELVKAAMEASIENAKEILKR